VRRESGERREKSFPTNNNGVGEGNRGAGSGVSGEHE